VCECVYIYTYVCVYICVCIYICIYVCIYICMYVCIRTWDFWTGNSSGSKFKVLNSNFTLVVPNKTHKSLGASEPTETGLAQNLDTGPSP
jgi:hypothetical protein